ncbi:hypothetical protein CHS0354_014604 [Potamilus streckersoni]|uniref:Uncharacterized protein n=1 Tax=Potamilus streckersoni TaxID=2493646 RepID=A0AAE0RNS9_9BIVA|nr:hypothetical protein CHS0354_014604 [Potamilus streckersoni]
MSTPEREEHGQGGDSDTSTATVTPPTSHYSNLESVPEETDTEAVDDFGQNEEIVGEDYPILHVLEESHKEAEDDDGRKPQSGRLPTLQSRARLIRTPAKKDRSEPESALPRYSDTGSQQQISDEMQLTQGNSNILITELRDHEEITEFIERDGFDEGKENLEQTIQTITIETVDQQDKEAEEQEEWDTDLEIDVADDEDSLPEHDPSGRSDYEKYCQSLGVVPISYFLRHITDSEITMRWHGLGPVAAKAIALVLRDNITLEKLNLQGNWMQGEGCVAMARMLEENDYITELNLADNKLGTIGAQSLCQMLGVNATLRKLDISGNDFTDKDASTFALGMENAKYLRELNLSRNLFGIEAGEILGPAIGGNDILESLDLSWNQIRGSGAIALAKGVQENIRLKYCNLSWNGFGPEGGTAIATALENNNTLIELDISGNRLTADTVLKMAKAIAKNDTLKVLRMGNNLLTTAGAIALATSISQSESSQLEELDITDVPVEFEFLRIIEEIKSKKVNFTAKYGPVLRSGNTAEDIGKPAIDPFKRKEPILLLKEHIVVNDMRLVEVLKHYDPEGKLSVTPEDFIHAVEDLAVPFDKKKLEMTVKQLADRQSGRIFFGDFLDQQNRANMMNADKDVRSTNTNS